MMRFRIRADSRVQCECALALRGPELVGYCSVRYRRCWWRRVLFSSTGNPKRLGSKGNNL